MLDIIIQFRGFNNYFGKIVRKKANCLFKTTEITYFEQTF